MKLPVCYRLKLWAASSGAILSATVFAAVEVQSHLIEPWALVGDIISVLLFSTSCIVSNCNYAVGCNIYYLYRIASNGIGSAQTYVSVTGIPSTFICIEFRNA